jgi:hypothetical protein
MGKQSKHVIAVHELRKAAEFTREEMNNWADELEFLADSIMGS